MHSRAVSGCVVSSSLKLPSHCSLSATSDQLDQFDCTIRPLPCNVIHCSPRGSGHLRFKKFFSLIFKKATVAFHQSQR